MKGLALTVGVNSIKYHQTYMHPLLGVPSSYISTVLSTNHLKGNWSSKRPTEKKVGDTPKSISSH